MASIKMRRAARLAETGKYPRTWDAIAEAIPARLRAELTAAQIALVADAMRRQHERGRNAP